MTDHGVEVEHGNVQFLYHPTLDIARSITEIHPYLEYLAASPGLASKNLKELLA